MKEIFEIKLVNIKNNFLCFNESVQKKLSSSALMKSKQVFKITIDNSVKGVFTLNPTPYNLEDWEVGVNTVLAKVLNLEEGQTVTCTSVDKSIPEAKSVSVSPASEEDYEILELNSHNIQDNLLDQLQALTTGQTFIVWPTPHLHINLIVDFIEPKTDMVLLSNATELHVSPHPRSLHCGVQQQHQQFATQSSHVWTGVQRMFRALVGSQESDIKPEIKEDQSSETDVIFRVHPILEKMSNPSIIKIHSKFMPKFNFAKVEILWNKKTDIKYAYVQIEKSDTLIPSDPHLKLPIVYFQPSSFSDYNIETGSKVILKPITIPSDIDKITIKCSKDINITAEEIQIQLENLVTKHNNSLLLNSGSKLQLSKGIYVTVELEKEFAVLSQNQIERCNIKVITDIEDAEITSTENTESSLDNSYLDNVWGNLFNEVLLSLHCNLMSPLKSVMIVRGQSGSGKSCLCSLLQNQVTATPNHVHWASVDCRPLKGKQVENLRTHFLKVFQECVCLQPAVVSIENLEVFCPSPSMEQRETAEASYCLSVQELVWELGVSCSKIHNIVLLATTSNNNAFHWPNDITPVEVFTMPELSMEHKCSVLSHYLNNSETICDHSLVKTVIKFTEGYRIQDIKDLADRIIFNIWKRIGCGEEAPVTVLRTDVSTALTDFVPLGMRGVKLFSSRAPPPDLQDSINSEILEGKWANVGGLQDIKQNLTELIEWPSKYPHLFLDAPLKLQMGVVLYGMPGSGKTLIAAELARTSGANFISVKGPELLSKYIGASEQAVRDLFDKAHSAKPCILFFDEFDSLAPSRGRDTTGVSDRVVNQLLTSLDGVDSPTDSGVWVVAATSRPDLLDKALLRPGRLDTILHCSLPNKQDREDILQILARKLTMAGDFDWTEVAEKTDNFSGADLQAVLYTAQLAALEEALGEFQLESLEAGEPNACPSDVSICVTGSHVKHALTTTRPSLSRAEIARYDKIYNDFEKSRTPGESQNFIPAQRTTLA